MVTNYEQLTAEERAGAERGVSGGHPLNRASVRKWRPAQYQPRMPRIGCVEMLDAKAAAHAIALCQRLIDKVPFRAR